MELAIAVSGRDAIKPTERFSYLAILIPHSFP